MELFEIGDVVQHTAIYENRDHANRYFGGIRPLTIREIGPEDGRFTIYKFEGFFRIACRHRLELVERGGGPW